MTFYVMKMVLILIAYDVVCNNVLDLNKLEQVFEPCPSDTLYTVDHMSPCSGLLSKHKKLGNWENFPRGKLRY